MSYYRYSMFIKPEMSVSRQHIAEFCDRNLTRFKRVRVGRNVLHNARGSVRRGDVCQVGTYELSGAVGSVSDTDGIAYRDQCLTKA